MIIFNKNLTEKYPVITEVINPVNAGINSMPDKSNSRITAPRTAGIERMKENLAVFSLSKFLKSPADIVEPLLEIPGVIAMP